ncbi:MAG: signal recognition particle-docking protein FtsY [Nanoarchaeota archaeon]
MFKFLKEKLQGIFKSAGEDETLEENQKEVEKETKKIEKAKEKAKKAVKEDKKTKLKPKREKEVEKEEKISEKIDQAIEVSEQEIEKNIEKEVEREVEQEIKEDKEKIILEELNLEKIKEEQDKVGEKKSFFNIFKRKKSVEEVAQKKEEYEKELEEIEDLEEKREERKVGILSKIQRSFNTIKIDQEKFNEIFENLELVMLESNVALTVIDKIKEDMQKSLLDVEIKKSELENEIKSTLKNSLEGILLEPYNIIEKINSKTGTFVILFFGINGAGKTTTIAKIAHMLQKNNISCVLAAADTFRAASIEQLQKHGEKLNVKVIHQNYGADPAAVGFDAIKYAEAHNIKVVLIDTAGRMHTKENLLKEMEKIVRVTKPDLKIFVAESITGNDATEQAKNFNETAGIDGTILSKADVDENGGTSISIGYVTKKPILFLGTGQEYDDLEIFSPKKVIQQLGLE